jgi:hypothetical protein
MVDYVDPTPIPEPIDPAATHLESVTPTTEIRVTNPVINTVNASETNEIETEALGVIIPSAAGRKVAYAVYAGISLLVTNVAVGFSAIGANNPSWLTIALAVVGNLAAPFGAIAIANASGKK